MVDLLPELDEGRWERGSDLIPHHLFYVWLMAGQDQRCIKSTQIFIFMCMERTSFLKVSSIQKGPSD